VFKNSIVRETIADVGLINPNPVISFPSSVRFLEIILRVSIFELDIMISNR
jgi:hypothetical protein